MSFCPILLCSDAVNCYAMLYFAFEWAVLIGEPLSCNPLKDDQN